MNARAKFIEWPSQIASEPRGQYHAYGGLTPLCTPRAAAATAAWTRWSAGGAE